MRGKFERAEAAEDDHGAAATRAALEIAFGELAQALAIVEPDRRGRRLGGEQTPAQRELGLALAVGEKAVMADAVEAVGQRVQEEAAQELRKRDAPAAAVGC